MITSRKKGEPSSGMTMMRDGKDKREAYSILADREDGHVGRVARLELAGLAVEHRSRCPVRAGRATREGKRRIRRAAPSLAFILSGISLLFGRPFSWQADAELILASAPRRRQARGKLDMLEQEFDRFAQEYEQLHASVLAASGEGPEFFAAYKPADMRRHLAASGAPGAPLTLLDFGCGVGGSLPHLRREFPDAELIGADVSRKSLDIAERRYPGLATAHRLERNGTRCPCRRRASMSSSRPASFIIFQRRNITASFAIFIA